jgi:hypothetical protein
LTRRTNPTTRKKRVPKNGERKKQRLKHRQKKTNTCSCSFRQQGYPDRISSNKSRNTSYGIPEARRRKLSGEHTQKKRTNPQNATRLSVLLRLSKRLEQKDNL